MLTFNIFWNPVVFYAKACTIVVQVFIQFCSKVVIQGCYKCNISWTRYFHLYGRLGVWVTFSALAKAFDNLSDFHMLHGSLPVFFDNLVFDVARKWSTKCWSSYSVCHSYKTLISWVLQLVTLNWSPIFFHTDKKIGIK